MNKGVRKEGTSEKEMKGESGKAEGEGDGRSEMRVTLGRCTTSRPSTPRRPRLGETIKYT